jgi:hypothetical protein
MRFLAETILAMALLACTPAFAEEQPPARVGRVSFISGTLAFYGPGDSDWSAAKVNYPIAAGEWFATDPQSRAEIRIGAQTIDIAGDTQLDIADLGNRVIKAGVTQGRIDVNMRQFGPDESVEIDIPRGGVWLLQRGIYDIETGAADQPTRIAVFEGSARFVGGGADLIIRAGDAVVLSGNDTVAATVERATVDDFVKWCRSRDYHQERLAAPYHVPPAMTGFEELDAYGGWDTVPDYGAVWYPKSVPADWAPYRDGHWVWVEPWGWNWVDAEPWGFAPFHYGRWARIDERWGWVPGNFVPQPVYAPALVAFIEDPGIGPSAPLETGPAVGWFPLAPGEVYWPNYTRDPVYIRNVNIANVSVTNITEIKTIATARRTDDPPPQVANQQFANRGAATVVPARIFADSGRVAPAALAVPPQALQRAPVSLRPPQLTPTAARPASPAPTASVPAMQPMHGPSAQAVLPAPGHPPGPPNFSGLAPAPSGPHGRPQLAQQPLQAAPAAPVPGHPTGPPNFSNLAPAPGAHGQPAVTQQPAQAAPPPPTPGHPPGPPNFSHLAPAAGVHGQPPVTQQPAPAAPAPPTPGHLPGPPNFSHLALAAGAHGQPAPTQQPAQVAPAPPTPGHPPGPPNFSHLAPAPGFHRQAPQPPPTQAAQGGPPAAAHAPPPAIAQAPAPHSPAPPSGQAPQQQNQSAVEQVAQQRAAAQAAAQQQAQQRAAAQAAAQQQAQQRAAAQAAAQQQAQQRAAAQAAAQQQAQQRAAAQAAAQQQAQQRAAAQAAAQQGTTRYFTTTTEFDRHCGSPTSPSSMTSRSAHPASRTNLNNIDCGKKCSSRPEGGTGLARYSSMSKR